MARIRAARLARIAAAAVALAAAVFGFLASGAAAEATARVVASWQAFPLASKALRAALEGFSGLAAAALVQLLVLLAGLLALSALLGRWYCSILCPLGALQDLARFLGRRPGRYRRPANAARAVSFLAVAALALAGAMSLAALLDPWSIFSRFLSYDLQPAFRLASGLDVPGAGFWNAAIPAASMAAILVLAVLRGRWFCNALCPAGTLLGLLNRFAPFRVRMEESACISCGACALRCPASCIDVARKRLDASRCVDCLACLDACPTAALRYGAARAVEVPPGKAMSRKRFLASLGGGAATLALAALPGRALAERAFPARPETVPPGAGSRKRFLETCVACGLCVSVCPSRVLQPSLGQLGARALFVPRLDYSVAYCQYECVSCLRACPSGALRDMSLAEKKLVKIGTASLVRPKCIVIVQRTKCGACAERCPTGAVRMFIGPTGLPEPKFTSDICIGCGACHYACPALPERAITVAGLEVHQTAVKPPPGLFDAPAERDGGGQAGGAAGGGTGDFPF